jgi:ribose transport system substrate-binding protein
MTHNRVKQVTHWSHGLLLVAVTLLQTGCKHTQQATVGLVVTTLSNPYFVTMANAAKAEDEKSPALRLVVQAPDQAVDVSKQIGMIDDLIAQKPAAICLVPADSKAVIPSILRANEANIPVLILDADIDEGLAKAKGAHIASFIGSDNVAGGGLAGDYIKQHLPAGGEVAVLEGVSGVDAAEQRRAGFLKSIQQQPSIRIVASQPADWDREKALNIFQSILQGHPNIAAVFAANDEMALGAIKAIQAAGKTGKIIVVGFDATKDGLAAVKDGQMSATVAQQPDEEGKMCVDMAEDLINHKTIAINTRIPVKLGRVHTI